MNWADGETESDQCKPADLQYLQLVKGAVSFPFMNTQTAVYLCIKKLRKR